MFGFVIKNKKDNRTYKDEEIATPRVTQWSWTNFKKLKNLIDGKDKQQFEREM